MNPRSNTRPLPPATTFLSASAARPAAATLNGKPHSDHLCALIKTVVGGARSLAVECWRARRCEMNSKGFAPSPIS